MKNPIRIGCCELPDRLVPLRTGAAKHHAIPNLQAMKHLMKTSAPVLAVVAVLAMAGCVSTDYVGKSYAPTSQVDLYFSEADITLPYEVMGEVRMLCRWCLAPSFFRAGRHAHGRDVRCQR